MADLSVRAGRFVQQPQGYRAFIPASLPPMPALDLGLPTIALLSRADQALGRLDGVARRLPNSDLFVAMYVRREAVLSSQIEGTQSTLEDVLTFELGAHGREVPRDVEEVVNYVSAMNHGLQRMTSLPLSLRLIREIHGELLRGVRGQERSPGQFRTSQNWIGAGRVTLERATFVPPPPYAMQEALDNFERFLHDDSLPVLAHSALAHAQFETIHPFLDGNGRVGRLLITLLLCYRGVLRRPLLYLSAYLKAHRIEYYDRLMAIRERGDWEGWLHFFLRGVEETATEATRMADNIVEMQERHRRIVQDHKVGLNGLRLLDLLYQRPVINVGLVSEALGLTFRPANIAIRHLVDIELLQEVTGARRNRRFRYGPYIALFDEPSAPADALLRMPQITTGPGAAPEREEQEEEGADE